MKMSLSIFVCYEPSYLSFSIQADHVYGCEQILRNIGNWIIYEYVHFIIDFYQIMQSRSYRAKGLVNHDDSCFWKMESWIHQALRTGNTEPRSKRWNDLFLLHFCPPHNVLWISTANAHKTVDLLSKSLIHVCSNTQQKVHQKLPESILSAINFIGKSVAMSKKIKRLHRK